MECQFFALVLTTSGLANFNDVATRNLIKQTKTDYWDTRVTYTFLLFSIAISKKTPVTVLCILPGWKQISSVIRLKVSGRLWIIILVDFFFLDR